MHRAPHALVAGQDACRHDDVADDDDCERDGRDAVDEVQRREQRACVDDDEADAAHDQQCQQPDDRHVRQPLTRIEMAFVPAEAAGERGRGQANEPADTAGFAE